MKQLQRNSYPRVAWGALAAAFTVAVLCTSPARAQTGGELMLKAWPKEQAVDATADAYFYNGGHVQETDSGVRLGIYETEGRFRLFPGELASPRVGYAFTTFDLNGPRASLPGRVRLPDQLYDASAAVAVPVGKYQDWIVGVSAGVGYAGASPFADGNAWYGKADVAVFRQLDKGSAIAFVLDYDGNRTYLPDVPLPGFAYIKRLDPKILLTAGLPVTSIEWRPTDDLRLELTYALVDDVTARVGYTVVPHFELYTSVAQRRNAFHLDELPQGNRRLLFEQRRAEVGLTWRPSEAVDLTVAGGYAWGGQFSAGFDFRTTRTVAELSDEPYIRAGLQIRF